MSQTTIGAPSSVGGSIADILETLGNTWLKSEQLKAGMPLGYANTSNNPADYPHITTGVNSDGSTLISGQWVSGVDNKHLAAGVGLLLAAGIIAYAYS